MKELMRLDVLFGELQVRMHKARFNVFRGLHESRAEIFEQSEMLNLD